MATHQVARVEPADGDRLVVHCAAGTSVEIEASGEQRRWWLEDAAQGTVFDVVRGQAKEPAETGSRTADPS